MFSLKKLGFGIIMAGLLGFSSQASATVIVWDLINHGGGGLGPNYGFRSDFLAIDPNNGPTFSFDNTETAQSDARLIFDNVAGTARIVGTLLRNESGSVTTDDVWSIDYTLSGVNVLGETSFTATGGNGVLTDSGGEEFAFQGRQSGGAAFRWLADGHRISGDSTTLVGRGWVEFLPTSEQIELGLVEPDETSYNDFLFVGERISQVPLPPAVLMMLAALGGLGVIRFRRKT